jgi:hypothetical protein
MEMENVTNRGTRRNKKAPLRDEINRLLKEQNVKLKEQGIKPLFMDTKYNEKNVLLQIDKPRRVNLSVTPEIYQKALKVGSEVEKLIKFDTNPCSSKFWYGLLEIVDNSLDVLYEQKKDAETHYAVGDRIMERFKFKTEEKRRALGG